MFLGSGPNSAGGVTVEFYIRNQTEKVMKYVTFVVTPYNAVDDPVACTIRDVSRCQLELTGPISPNGRSTGSWENVWYNYTVAMVKLAAVEIEYMDGTVETVDANDIEFGDLRTPGEVTSDKLSRIFFIAFCALPVILFLWLFLKVGS